ncbi:MAG: aldo/keto reductase [Anaerolineae bacterium]|nr:aldo/keto reductase [Anaerolineae bacterium]
MEYRRLGRTEMDVSVISFGAWAIGADWGNVSEEEALGALNTAIDMGVNFIDTADVYGDGRSERLIAQTLKQRSEKVYVATKAGRRLNPHTPEGYNYANLNQFVERSLKNLDTETLDLVQLHCPPTPVYEQDETFAALERLVREGKIRYYGISVEKVDEALTALERYPNIQSVQIIFNMFRLKPADEFFATAKTNQVGILARVPLASGMLTGKMTPRTEFAEDDHRNYNRHGEAFDVGETFSGVPYEVGLQAVEELKAAIPAGYSMVQAALRWITMFNAVTCAIPGAKRPAQARENFVAAEMAPLPEPFMQKVQEVYDTYIREHVHHLW